MGSTCCSVSEDSIHEIDYAYKDNPKDIKDSLLDLVEEEEKKDTVNGSGVSRP